MEEKNGYANENLIFAAGKISFYFLKKCFFKLQNKLLFKTAGITLTAQTLRRDRRSIF